MGTGAIKTIVVPTDCSPLALNALRYADRLAARTGAAVVAVYGTIFESPDGVGVAAALASADDREMMMSPVRRCIEEALAKSLSNDTRREIVLADAEAADAIVEVSNRRDADLIIIGTRDRNRVVRVVLGSVTDAVLRMSKRPVLVLREHNTADSIQRVVCNASLASEARRLADAAGAELLVMNGDVGDGAEGDVIVVGSSSSQIVRTAHCPVLVVRNA
jgi:universal stress protein E